MRQYLVNLPDAAASALEETAQAQGVSPVLMLARLVIVSLVPADERAEAFRQIAENTCCTAETDMA